MADATLEEVTAALKAADEAGDTAAAQTLAQLANRLLQSSTNQPFAREIITPQQEMDDFSALERGWYEFRTEEGFTENAGIYLESLLPLGNIDPLRAAGKGFYASPTELYGEDFRDLTKEQRRERIQEVRYQRQLQKYPELTRLEEEGAGTGAAGFTGVLAGALFDPATLLPVGKTVPAMIAMGGLVSGGYEAARGLAEEGQIDPLMTGVYTAGGAVAAPVLVKTMAAIAPAYNRLRAAVRSKKTVKDVEEANLFVDEINSKMMQLKEEGVEDVNLLLAAAERLDVNPNKLQDAVAKSSTKLDIPWANEPNKAVLETMEALAGSKVTNDVVDRVINTTIRQVKKFSPVVAQRLQKFEMDQSVISARFQHELAPFLELSRRIPNRFKNEFAKRLYNGHWDDAAQLAKDAGITTFKVGESWIDRPFSKVTSSVDEAMEIGRKVLNDVHQYADDGLEEGVSFLPNYFPRNVKDYQGLLRALGIKEDAFLRSQLRQKAKDLGLKSVTELNEKQRIEVLNAMLSGNPRYTPKGASWVKQREIENVDDDLMKYYGDDVRGNITNYINKTINHVEKYKFFKDNNALGGLKGEFNTELSVGALVDDLVKKGKFKGDTEDLKNILKTRFGAGEESPHTFLQNLRSFTNTLLLGNPMSALIQAGDQFVNLYRYGMKDGGKAIIESALGRTVTNVDDFGLRNFIAADISGGAGTAKAIQDSFMKLSGFRAMDRFGKNSLLQGAWNKATRLAKSDKGIKKLKEEWGETFGNEFDSLVSDLQAGKVSENAKLLLWNELSGSQPISLSDMPQKYLGSPDGRIFYQLRSFTLKQIQLLADDVKDEFDKGNYAKAGKNAVAYAVLVGGGNAAVQEARNAARGRGFDIERLPEHWLNYLMSTALTSKFGVDQLAEGNVAGFVESALAPPLGAIGDLANDAVDIAGAVKEGRKIDPKEFRRVPGLGDLYYNLFGGGAEEFLQEERRERRRR